jgi:hypothetical protein
VLGLSLNYSNTFSSQAKIASAGVWGDSGGSNSGNSAGVLGTADNVSAGAFINNSAGSAAVYAYNAQGPSLHAESHAGVAGWGIVDTNGDGLVGLARGLVSEQAGVMGIGVKNSSAFGLDMAAGVWGDNGGPSGEGGASGDLWNVGVAGTAGDGVAGAFTNNSSSGWPTLYAHADAGGSNGLFKTFMATSDTGTCGIGGSGDLTCTGQVKTLADAGGGSRKVETYAMQSPENWMEDFGSGQVEHGAAFVEIDPSFAETVSESAAYHVFLTPKGDSKGLYVTNETATGFEVHESGDGTSSLSFDYRIVAKRRGYESQRLTDVTDRYRAETLKTTLRKASSTAHKLQIPSGPAKLARR